MLCSRHLGQRGRSRQQFAINAEHLFRHAPGTVVVESDAGPGAVALPHDVVGEEPGDRACERPGVAGRHQ